MSTKITKANGKESLEQFSPEGTQDLRFRAPEPSSTDSEATFPSIEPGSEPTARSGTRDSSDFSDRFATEKQIIEDFQFLTCDPIDLGEVIEECPLCEPNKYAYVPDYRAMDHGNVFFDGKKCMQSIVLALPSPTMAGPTVSEIKSSDFQREYKRRGIRLILDYFNKSDIATVFYYVEEPALPATPAGNTAKALAIGAGAVLGGIAGASLGGKGLWGVTKGVVGATLGTAVGGTVTGAAYEAFVPESIKGYQLVSEERNVVQELLKYTKIEHHVPIQSKGRTRILVSVPVEYLNRVPSKLETVPTAPFETDYEVEFNANQYYPMFRRVIRSLKIYANRHDTWVALDGGAFTERTTASADDYGTAPTKKKRTFLLLDTH